MKTAHRKQANAKRQHRADPFAMWKAVARTTGFNDAEQTACVLPVHLAWASLKGGNANEHDIATLADVVAICLVAAEKGDALVQHTAEAARLAMVAIADRYTRIHQWGVDAAALRDIPHALNMYDDLLSIATGGQMDALLQHIKQAKAQLPAVLAQ